MNIPHIIREALDSNDDNHMTAFLRNYYQELLRKADGHKIIVQTNRDKALSDAVIKSIKQQLND